MKNIAILELHFHIKFLYTTMRIAKQKDTKVTVFTTEKIHKRLITYLKNDKSYEFVLKKDSESKSSYLNRVEKICNEKIDLLLVNTIQLSCINVPAYIGFNPKCKKILTLHILNHWLVKKIAIGKNIPRSLDVTLCMFLVRKFIIPKYDGLNVVYAPLKEYIRNNTYYQKPIYTLPFNFYDEKKQIEPTKKDKKINFVIPGLIETYRRDYDFALDVFAKLFEDFNERINLTILGKPVGPGGKRIIQRCKGLKDQGYNISYSEKFIEENDYNQALRNSDIIFSPLKVVTKRNTGIVEIYGKTEGSALPFEAIQFARPLIVPKEFNIDDLKSSSLQYKNKQELEKILKNIINKEISIDELSKNAELNSKKYSLEILQKYFQTIF